MFSTCCRTVGDSSVDASPNEVEYLRMTTAEASMATRSYSDAGRII